MVNARDFSKRQVADYTSLSGSLGTAGILSPLRTCHSLHRRSLAVGPCPKSGGRSRLEEGIFRQATAALATARQEQRSMIQRKAKTNAWATTERIVIAVSGFVPEGASRLPSLATFDSRS